MKKWSCPSLLVTLTGFPQLCFFFFPLVSCNLGKVAANAMMTARHKRSQEIEAYIALFVYAQQFYGSKYSEEFTFKMFVSEFDHRDLIFQVKEGKNLL